jgi:hypothetical protein
MALERLSGCFFSDSERAVLLLMKVQFAAVRFTCSGKKKRRI